MSIYATDEALRPTTVREAAADTHASERPYVLPNPYRCDDPWCPNAAMGVHLHGTSPT